MPALAGVASPSTTATHTTLWQLLYFATTEWRSYVRSCMFLYQADQVENLRFFGQNTLFANTELMLLLE